ncbi:MAG: NAD-dependent epimerase/dehydratase family protein [Rhodospirillales bacterium]|nr:NAD-dependent epimerase/dehydratase family protein [Rhodospirillales bacterium]
MGIRALTQPGSDLKRVMIVGGAGFIGSHFTDRLLAEPSTERVTLFDNFSSGHEWHYAHHADDARLSVVRGDAGDRGALAGAIAGHDTVIHLAANPDIARAATEPAIDFDEGTVLTNNVLEAMRTSGCNHILYASGSGVYGDRGDEEVAEDFGPMLPISTYGASKLACEALISSYCHMFGLRTRIFRFGNVVGPRQTHGVGYDFIAKLRRDPSRLDILGDGQQSKPYIHVDDVVSAVLFANGHWPGPLGVFNAATGDAITVREIADMVVDCLGLAPGGVDYVFTGGARGWSGDVPVVRLNCDRLKRLGWSCQNTSGEAMRRSIEAMLEQ